MSLEIEESISSIIRAMSIVKVMTIVLEIKSMNPKMKYSMFPTIYIHMKMPQKYVLYMAQKSQPMNKLKKRIIKAENGVIMGGVKDNSPYFQHKNLHGLNYKVPNKPKTIVVVQESMEDIWKIKTYCLE